MKHALALILYTLYFTYRGFIDPSMGILPYYTFAVLRPQACWEWSLPPGVRWSLYAAIAAVLVTIANANRLSLRRINKPFVLAIVLFAVMIAVSYLGALDHKAASRVIEEYSKILLMMIIAALVIREPKHLRYLGVMVFVCLSYLVFNVNQLYLIDHRLDIFRDGYAGYDNNGAALMLAMVIPFCYFLFVAERRFWRWGYLLAVLPAAHAIMLTYSRGAMLSSIVTAVPMVLVGSKKRIRSIIIMIIMGALILSLAGVEVRKRFSSIGDAPVNPAAQGSVESRYMSWNAGWGIIKDYPVFGVGPRNSGSVIKSYGADFEGRTIHNLYIQVAADTGIPSLLAFLAMLFIAMRGLWRTSWSIYSQLEDKERRWHFAICQASFWSLFLYSFGSMFLSTELFELPYLLMVMGAAAKGALDTQQAPKKSPAPKAVVLGSPPLEGIS